LRDAPGGMPADTVLVLNADEPQISQYQRESPWPIEYVPAGSRFCDVWRHIFAKHAGDSYYGMLGDDHVPQTPGWHEELVHQAGNLYLAYPNGDHTEFPLMRGVCVIGGGLARAIGWIVPPGFVHHYIDVVLDQIGRDTGTLRPVAHHRVDHLHWRFTNTPRDETYLRGGTDEHEDQIRYQQWMASEERTIIRNRIMMLLTQSREIA
jgi:hypothetical protein